LSRNTSIYGTRILEAPKCTALPESVPEDPVKEEDNLNGLEKVITPLLGAFTL
jgi:hypothetical protein